MRNETFLMFVLVWIPTLLVGAGVAGCLISQSWCEEAHHWSQRWLWPAGVGLALVGTLTLLIGGVVHAFF